MGLLDRAGAEMTADPETAEILVVNTCSFIDSAKQESVDTILEMAQHKTTGRARKLIVAGCLVERYRDEIRKNIPEVDAVVGTGELEAILSAAGLTPACASSFGDATALQHPYRCRNHPPRAGRCCRIARRRRSARVSRDASRASSGMAQRRSCRSISTTTRRRACWRRGKTSAYHQDRRRMRPSLQLLRDSESARQVPLPAL